MSSNSNPNFTQWCEQHCVPCEMQLDFLWNASEFLRLRDVLDDRWTELREQQSGIFWVLADSQTAQLELEAEELSSDLLEWLPEEIWWPLTNGCAW